MTPRPQNLRLVHNHQNTIMAIIQIFYFQWRPRRVGTISNILFIDNIFADELMTNEKTRHIKILPLLRKDAHIRL